MKPEELSIGDLVLYREVPHKIHLTDFAHQMDENIFEKFEPIPLTTEILEKNDFYYCKIDNTYNVGEVEIYHNFCNHFSCNVCGTTVKPTYVHELQHVLRLVGLNKMADNFKV